MSSINHIGSHISLQKDLFQTLKQANDLNMTAIQIFLGSPYSLKRRQITEKDISKCNSLLDDPNKTTQVFTHLPYVYNLAGSIKNNKIAWASSESNETDNYIKECLQSIDYELETLDKLNCSCKGCVLHIGSCKDKIKGLQSVAKSINQCSLKTNTPLLLETMVGSGTVLGKTFEDLAYVHSLVDQEKQSKIGFCIDTCHVFASGQYDLSKISEIDKMFEDFDRVCHSNSLKLIHLNDSKESFSSSKDRHQLLMKGHIWSEDNKSLYHLIKVSKARNVPLVLETSETDFINLKEICEKL